MISSGTVVRVVEDRGSGFRGDRPGPVRLPVMVSAGGVVVVWVTREDRPAWFGIGRPRRLFAVHAVVLEVPHPTRSGGRPELLEDFGSLATIFAGRWYGRGSAQARERLLAETGRRCEDGAV